MAQWIWCVIGLVVLIVLSVLCARWGSAAPSQLSYNRTLERLLGLHAVTMPLAIVLQWSRWGRVAAIAVVVSIAFSFLRYIFVASSLEAGRKQKEVETRTVRRQMVLEQHDATRKSISDAVAEGVRRRG